MTLQLIVIFPRVIPVLLVALSLLGSLLIRSGQVHAQVDLGVCKESDSQCAYGAHAGYVTDIAQERFQRVVEIVFVPPPPPMGRPLREIIFNAKLSQELHGQYEGQFGRTDIERNFNTPTRFDGFEYSHQSVTAQEYQTQQRLFGEYMARRLIETHLDHYVKNNPDIRPVYELKERISHVNVQVREGYKLRLHYSYSGNYASLRMDNPYNVHAKVQIQMDPTKFGPNDIQETTAQLGYSLTKTIHTDAYYKLTDQQYQLVLSKRLTPHLSTSFTAQQDNSDLGATPKQDLVLVGFTLTD